MGKIFTFSGQSMLTKLLATGQTTQYASMLDDGYYYKGIVKAYSAVLTAGQYSGTTNITINGKTQALSNNCVIDNNTGLMWCNHGSSAPAALGPASDGKLPWTTNANSEGIFPYAAAANAAGLAGYSDWRIPNIFEWLSLWTAGGTQPQINTTAFPSWVSSNFWSSTTDPNTTTSALYVLFGSGSPTTSSAKTTTARTGLVRG